MLRGILDEVSDHENREATRYNETNPRPAQIASYSCNFCPSFELAGRNRKRDTVQSSPSDRSFGRLRCHLRSGSPPTAPANSSWRDSRRHNFGPYSLWNYRSENAIMAVSCLGRVGSDPSCCCLSWIDRFRVHCRLGGQPGLRKASEP